MHNIVLTLKNSKSFDEGEKTIIWQRNKIHAISLPVTNNSKAFEGQKRQSFSRETT